VSEPYSQLLARYRYEYVRRVSSQGMFVSKAQPTLTPLTLFTQAPELGAYEPAAYSAVLAAAEARAARPLAQWRAFLNQHTLHSMAALASLDGPAAASMFSLYGWLGASPAARVLHAALSDISTSDLVLARRVAVAPVLQVGARGALSPWPALFAVAPLLPVENSVPAA
jgi:hypothetical protein